MHRLRHRFWVVYTALIALAAFLDARGIMELVGISIAPEATAFAATTPLPARGSPEVVAHRSAEPLIRRNPFDHATGALDRSTPLDSAEANDASGAPKCDGLKVLVVAASDDPEWSLAAFRSNEGKSILRRRGGDVNGKTVRFVGAERVWLESEGHLCHASPFDNADEPRKPTTASSPTTGIKKVGPAEYDVDRALIERLAENPAELLRQVRLVPSENGLRLSGIKPNTLFAVLGMQNGDRLETVNGFEVANPQRALEAFARLRTADALRLVVERNGQKATLDYKIK